MQKENRMIPNSYKGSSNARFMKVLWIASLAAIMACAIMPATAAAQQYDPESYPCNGLATPNLLTNGNFGTGDLTGWKVAFPNPPDPYVFVSSSRSQSTPPPGQSLPQQYNVWLGTIPGENRISQSVTTQAGQVYLVCFYLANDLVGYSGFCCGSSFEAKWQGFDLMTMVQSGPFDYQYFVFQVEGTGSPTLDVLTFQHHQVPAFYHLSSVSMQLCTGCTLRPPPGKPK
jgi:hypothetical protein